MTLRTATSSSTTRMRGELILADGSRALSGAGCKRAARALNALLTRLAMACFTAPFFESMSDTRMMAPTGSNLCKRSPESNFVSRIQIVYLTL